MREIDFLDAVGRVDERYIEECLTYRSPKRINVWISRIGAAAACFMLAVAAVFIAQQMNQPVIIDENGFYIEDGVLLRYTGADSDITIPDEVKTIADFAFLENANRKKIEVVRLGAGVQQVEVDAFAGLENLDDIVIDANSLSFAEEDGLLMSADGAVLLHYNREGETSFTIPASVRFIAAHAVQATALEEINFGENLTYIGYNAFASNTKLNAIYLPDSLQYISEGGFSGCGAAVDGYIPGHVEFGGEAFSGVPFYLSALAGQMSPLEERVRGLISAPEAIAKSNSDAVEKQVGVVLAALRGENVTPIDEATRRAYRIGQDAPEIPEGMVVPTSFTMSDLTYADGTYVYDVGIQIPAGDYTIVLQAIPENMNTALYWEDVVYRVLNLFYLQNPETAAPEDTVSAFGWTAVFAREGDDYGNVTFTHEDGRVVHNNLGYLSAVRPTITFSPEGTRAAVEYRHKNGRYCFYVVTLNGDVLMAPNYPYAEYLNSYYGDYVQDTLVWVDEDTIEGINEFGQFRYNIYEFEVTIIEKIIPETTNGLTVAPALSAKVNQLPRAAETARIKHTVVGGSPVVYVFDDEMRFYLAYLKADMQISSVVESNLILPNGYTDGRIIAAESTGGSGEFRLSVSAQVSGIRVMFDYFFCCDGDLPRQESVALHNPSDAMLYLTVSELERKYGRLTLEYSEHGPGQPIYSAAYIDGVYFVFHNWNMDDPLAGDMIPDELIVTNKVEYSVQGITVGQDISEFVDSLAHYNPEASYSVMDGTVKVKLHMDDMYSAECLVRGRDFNLPDEVTATAADWERWAKDYLRSPTGIISQIRIRLNA